MTRRAALLSLSAVALLALAAGPRRAAARNAPMTAHDFAFLDIDGAPLRLNAFAGKAVLVVNTASRCGYTGQLDGMQKLWSAYRDRGLVVLAVPSDDFNQELSTEAEVKEFCEMNFGTDFPMTSITRIRGTARHPFYAWAEQALGGAGVPRWNFHKLLIGPDGRAITAFGTGVEPTAPKVIAAVEKALGIA
jgi:glutathione peroxidase